MQQQEAEGLKATIQEIEQARRQLQALGIDLSKLAEAQSLIAQLEQAQERISSERQKQFWSDAADLAASIKAGNKVKELALYLRQYAEYIAGATLRLANVETKHDIQTLVDSIGPMSEAQEEEAETSK